MSDQGCPRCGVADCGAEKHGDAKLILECRDREIANLHAFRRQLIRKVERLGDAVSDLLESISE